MQRFHGRVLLVALLAMCGGRVGARTAPAPCADGAFLVATAARAVPGTQPGSDVFVVRGGTVRIEARCPEVSVKTHAARRRTTWKATWPSGACTGLGGKVRLEARVAAPACSAMTGILHVAKTKPKARRFKATRLAVSTVIAAGDALGGLGVEPEATIDPAAPNRPGEREGPASLAVTSDGVLVLDPVNGRIVRVADGAATPYDVAEFYTGAFDLLASPEGALWVVGSAACRCVRMVTGAAATGVDLPIGEGLFPGRLAGSTSLLTLDGPDGPHVIVRDGAPSPPFQQSLDPLPGVWHPGLAAAVAAILPDAADARTIAVHGTRTDGTAAFDATVDVLGAPTSVPFVAPACNDTILLVAAVVGSDGFALSMVRIDATGKVLARGWEPVTPGDGTVPRPYRAFAASAAGVLYELRVTADGYAIVAWPTGC